MARIIEIFPYDPDWALKFIGEVEKITTVMGPNLDAAHHIGSTAVPGLAAKPTIDILCVVRDLDALDACSQAMQNLGYTAKGENGIPGRRYFQRLEGERHLSHIHTFKDGHPEIARYLNFRDYLIAHPHIAIDYQVLKEKLALHFRDFPQQYTLGKTDFISAMDERAVAWRAGLNPVNGKDYCAEMRK